MGGAKALDGPAEGRAGLEKGIREGTSQKASREGFWRVLGSTPARRRCRGLSLTPSLTCSAASHVFICLQDWDVQRLQFIGPRPLAPPYGVDPDAVVKHYLQAGAASVSLHIVKSEELTYARHRMEQILHVRMYNGRSSQRSKSRDDR